MKVELVTTLKRHATQILKELHDSKETVMITEHGKPSAYILDYDEFNKKLERMELLEGLARGEKAYSDGRVVSHSCAKKRMKRWLK